MATRTTEIRRMTQRPVRISSRRSPKLAMVSLQKAHWVRQQREAQRKVQLPIQEWLEPSNTVKIQKQSEKRLFFFFRWLE